MQKIVYVVHINIAIFSWSRIEIDHKQNRLLFLSRVFGIAQPLRTFILGFLFYCLYSKNILGLHKVLLKLVHVSERSQVHKIKPLQHDYSVPKTKPGKVHRRREEQHHCSQI